MKIEIMIYEKDKQPSFYKKAIEEYKKRLSRYCPVEYKIIKKEKDWMKVLEKESGGYALLPGKTRSSEALSEELKKWELSGVKKISFYIMKEEEYQKQKSLFKEKLDNTFSISNYEMCPMMQCLLIHEQIYRGYRILNNHPYHK